VLGEQVRLEPIEVQALQKGLLLIRRNPWRAFQARLPTRTVVSDASMAGFGMMVQQDDRVLELSLPNPSDGVGDREHINVREAVALRLAVCRPENAGHVVRCVTDNTVLFWLLARQRAPRNDAMTKEFMRLLRWCYEHRTPIVPLWISTDNMARHGADEASRASVRGRRVLPFDYLSTCIELAEVHTAALLEGCRMPRRPGGCDLPRDVDNMHSQLFPLYVETPDPLWWEFWRYDSLQCTANV
jgi:hypothetical protein